MTSDLGDVDNAMRTAVGLVLAVLEHDHGRHDDLLATMPTEQGSALYFALIRLCVAYAQAYAEETGVDPIEAVRMLARTYSGG